MTTEETLPDTLADRVRAVADEQSIPFDHAHALVVTFGVEALDGVEVDAHVEDGRLLLECPRCDEVFDSPGSFVDHENHGNDGRESDGRNDE